MPDLIAVLIVIGVTAERAWTEWLHARERRYLINAAIADTPGELRVLEQPRRRKEPKLAGDIPDGFDGQVGL